MAALRKEYVWDGLAAFFTKKPAPLRESRYAREFANKVYKDSGGVTPDMKRLYADLLAHEQRSREA